jgi:hypothetical protein
VEYVPGGAVFPLAYDNDLSIGAVCFHQTMGVRNLFKWEELHWPSLIGPVSHSINDLLHGNIGVRKVLRAKQQARKGIQIDAERHVCQPIECDRLTASEKACHAHAATFPCHAQRIKQRAIADNVQDAITAVWRESPDTSLSFPFSIRTREAPSSVSNATLLSLPVEVKTVTPSCLAIVMAALI